ncbi:thermonuclease family protein [Silicimonas algicola]|uniref:Nuclease-like protein n=1 Tax=Silicimonas algicola TaxID=1826607 RepID=A0A316FYX7_9RHOB|nr:thermonuclease family protein [Silicimonas algicola]PWK52750.1 nuclease-like protein [Silicimonas algicola]
MLAKASLLAFAAALSAAPAAAIEHCEPRRNVTCVVDGATVWLQGELFRFQGYDVPRLKGDLCGGDEEAALGKKAADRLLKILKSGDLFMTRLGEDSNGKKFARLFVSGRDVGEILVAEGLARKAPDGRKFWCD